MAPESGGCGPGPAPHPAGPMDSAGVGHGHMLLTANSCQVGDWVTEVTASHGGQTDPGHPEECVVSELQASSSRRCTDPVPRGCPRATHAQLRQQ